MVKTYTIQERQQIEKKFHDDLVTNKVLEDVSFKQAFYADTAIENKFVLQFLSFRNKRILDLGCGFGEGALFFASKGARVDAIDISPHMIATVKKLTRKYHLSRNLKCQTMKAEKLKFPRSNFDYVYGSNILHHSTIELVLKQVSYVLKKGGKAFFIEPLKHNFVINIYRRLATYVRTPTESPLDYSQIDQMTKFGFKKVYHEEFHLLTLLIFIWFYLVEKINPNKERYWKKIIYDEAKYKKSFAILSEGDRFILTLIPFLKRFCWNTVIILEK